MKRGFQFRTVIIGLSILAAFAPTLTVKPVKAATATTTFQVTATVNATCLISATNLAFGAYTGTQTDATSTVTVTCTNTTPYNIGLNAAHSPGRR